ncbi:MAG: hypothetical protein MUF00_14520 [Gemmatimonadaceae bacterium]|jgi:hypothetical protein|nr:hypothetical protein [Gemmatimonadaceae bacterium]
MRTVTLARAALLGAFVAAPLWAQEASFPPAADFTSVHEAYAAGKVRPAATALRIASVELRRQLGRSQNDAIGMQLLAAESHLDNLASTIARGSGGAISNLESTFAATDRLLAEHHVTLANLAWERRARRASMDTLATDLGTAASYYERAFAWERRAPSAEAAAAIASAKSTARAIAAAPSAPPKETGLVIGTLLRTMTVANPVVIAATTP